MFRTGWKGGKWRKEKIREGEKRECDINDAVAAWLWEEKEREGEAKGSNRKIN